MVLVLATVLWIVLSALVPHLPRRWWHSPSIALCVTAPVLVVLAAQEMGPDVAGLMAVALMLMIRWPFGRAGHERSDTGRVRGYAGHRHEVTE
ncbi:DUF2484 family protein [Roseovarius aestuariivivens]|uniref:DUF2484 family protein n=1 Tax=Roseovarius aestuariivivens TaxID=1888910 RepID=UPI001080B4EC|nr:DUF2484 family protein [Roseovarius aestuariivivens]